MKRLFIAFKINPGKTFLEHYQQLQQQLRSEWIKWVEDGNIHVTLKFLGDTEESRIPLISKALQLPAREVSAFSIRLKGIGIFGSRYNPRVIWTGIEPYDEMAAVMQKVHDVLVPLGYEPDRQNLVPHVTLGRIRELRDKQNFQVLIDGYKAIESAPMILTEFILFESILKKEGPVYLPLSIFPCPGLQ